jgi:hypothetical protein
VPGLGGELDEGLMKGISGGLNHFRVVVVAAVQVDRHLKTSRPAIDLEGHANVRTSMAAAGRFDAGHFYLEFVHQLTPSAVEPKRGAPASFLVRFEIGRRFPNDPILGLGI